jgi:serine/alanine adding enzyme
VEQPDEPSKVGQLVEEGLRAEEARLEISTATSSDSDAWKRYVADSTVSRLCHDWRWSGISQTVFEHEPVYLMASRNDTVEGVLPLTRVRSRLFGDYLVSVPLLNYGGAIANSDVVATQLTLAAGEVATSLGCSHVEFRDDSDIALPLACRTDKVVMLRALPDSLAALDKEIGAKLRAQVKRPVREGATAHIGGAELVPEFYQVFAENMRDLGTPVYSIAFFEQVCAAFADEATVVVVRMGEQPVAGGFLLRDGTTMEIPWASSLRRFNRLGVNMMLYWQALGTAIEQGCNEFDFGRSSKDSSTLRFKQQWGAKPKQLYWHYWLPEGGEMPGLTPNNPKFALAVAAWKQLPLAIANRLGPHVVRGLP